MDLQTLALVNNSIFQRFPQDKIHKLQFNEAEDGQEGHGFENVENPIVVRKPVEITINKNYRLVTTFQTVKMDHPQPYYDITSSFTITGDDVLPVSGVASKSTYKNIPPNDNSELHGNPAVVHRFKSYTSNDPEFMVIALVPGLVGISDVVYDLDIETEFGDEAVFEIVTVQPVFYHHIPTDQTTTAVAIIFKCISSETFAFTYNSFNDLYVTLEFPYRPTPGVEINIAGSITCVGIIMEGANLMTISSHVMVTQEDLDDIYEKISDLRDDLVKLAEAFSLYTLSMKQVLDNQSEAIQALIREQNRQKTASDEAWNMITGVLDMIAALVPDPTIKLATGALSTVIKVAVKVRDFIIESGAAPYSMKMISAAQYFSDFIILNKYLGSKTEVDFSEILNTVSTIIGDEIDSEVVYVEHFVVELYGFGPIVNALNYIVSLPREELVSRNIYPVHSVIMIKSSNNRNMWYSVGGGDIISSTSRPEFINFVEWEGKSEDLPELVKSELRGRELFHVRGDVCVMKYESLRKYLIWSKTFSTPYDLLINNCHSSVDKIYEFASSGRLSPGDIAVASSIFV